MYGGLWTSLSAIKIIYLKNCAFHENNENKETILFIDASPYGNFAIFLEQDKNPVVNVISYNSRLLTDIEQKNSQIEKECLSFCNSCRRSRLYSFGRPFQIFYDNQTLV